MLIKKDNQGHKNNPGDHDSQDQSGLDIPLCGAISSFVGRYMPHPNPGEERRNGKLTGEEPPNGDLINWQDKDGRGRAFRTEAAVLRRLGYSKKQTFRMDNRAASGGPAHRKAWIDKGMLGRNHENSRDCH